MSWIHFISLELREKWRAERRLNDESAEGAPDFKIRLIEKGDLAAKLATPELPTGLDKAKRKVNRLAALITLSTIEFFLSFVALGFTRVSVVSEAGNTVPGRNCVQA
ncbi:hypothetical protein EON65_19350 [archaeon]|nr:MAG: hypothetical protein EON65_19350 [archaeon]